MDRQHLSAALLAALEEQREKFLFFAGLEASQALAGLEASQALAGLEASQALAGVQVLQKAPPDGLCVSDDLLETG
jgi:hypothetical protein